MVSLIRIQDGALGIEAADLIALINLVPGALQDRFESGRSHDQAIARQVVEQCRRCFLVEAEPVNLMPPQLVKSRWRTILSEALDEPYLTSSPQRGDHHPPVTVREGHYFVLGDHRNVSNDSRAWGQVPEDLILGKAVLRYWPPQRLGAIP